MNVDKIQHEIQTYITTLQNLPEYQKISISLTGGECKSAQWRKPNVVFRNSNASPMLENSLMAEKRIKLFVCSLLEAESIKQDIYLDVLFSNRSSNVAPKSSKSKDELLRLENVKVEEPKFSMEKVVLPQKTKNDLQNALSAITNGKLINETWGWQEENKSSRSVLCFYGAPGTGKTMCAHAIAKQLGKKILIASYADIQSMYVGEGPKNLKAVFDKAQNSDALLFFDEADSFLRKRTSDTTSSSSMHYNSMTNEMMKHLEDFNGIVIFATNLTDNTDEAFKTRITASIEFCTPDEDARMAIIQGMIPVRVPLDHQFTADEYRHIAQECEGLVGRDIRNAVHLVLCDGAEHNTYPFTVQAFIDGFKHYKENKENFLPGGKGKEAGKSINDQMEKMGINGSVISLLTYSAWYDGPETDAETEYLKDIAKILGRTKPIINKIGDLPKEAEMCEAISKSKERTYATLIYLCDLLAIHGDDAKNKEYLKHIVESLYEKPQKIEADILDYYSKIRQGGIIKEKIKCAVES